LGGSPFSGACLGPVLGPVFRSCPHRRLPRGPRLRPYRHLRSGRRHPRSGCRHPHPHRRPGRHPDRHRQG